MSNAPIVFPDINDSFIGASNLNIVCSNYIGILNRTEDFYFSQYANKLLEFIDSNKKISSLEKEFHEIKIFLRNWSKSNSVKLSITSRKKAFIRFNSKIRLFLSDGLDLNGIRDVLGFKLVLFTSKSDSLETQELAYKLMNDLLIFFSIQRKSLLLNAEDRMGEALQPDSEIAKRIFVYDKSLLRPEFKSKVKNYVQYPKDTGYQGLHAYIKTPTSLVFEIQVKTLAMDIFADSIHEIHKKQRYANFKIPLDYSKIQLPGVIFDENDYLISDKCGLLNSVDPFNIII